MVGFAALLKTGTVSLLVKNQIEELFSRELNGRLSIWKFDIDLPSGINAYQVHLYIGRERIPALTLDTLSLRLSYADFSEKGFQKILVPRIYLSGLTIRAAQNDSGQINFANLIKSLPPELDSKKPESGTSFFPELNLPHVEIRHAQLQWRRPNQTLTLRDFAWQSELKIGPNFVNGVLEELHFYVPEKDFQLSKGLGYFVFNESRSELFSFELATPNSAVFLTASLDNFNIFSPVSTDSLARARVYLEANASRIGKRDIEKFLPNHPLSKTNWSISAKAKGSAEKLSIENFQVRSDSSRVNLNGELRNWNSFPNMQANIKLENCALNLLEVQKLLGVSVLSRVASLQTVRFSGEYRGGLREAQAALQLNAAGININAAGNFSLDKDSLPRYAVTLGMNKLDLSKITGNRSWKSRLNIAGKLSGKGFSFETMQSHFQGRVDTSFVAGRNIRSLALDVQLNRKRFNGSLQLSAGEQKITLDGEADFSHKHPTYSAEGALYALDLSKILLDTNFSSHLNLAYEFKGDGMDLKNFSAQFAAKFDSSNIRDFTIAAGNSLSFYIDQDSTSSSVEFLSDVLDFHGQGNFDLSRLQLIGEREVAVIWREFQRNNIFRNEESLADSKMVKLPFSNSEVSEDSLNSLPNLSVEYDLQLKKIDRLATLLQLGDFEMVGSLYGKLESSSSCFYSKTELDVASARFNDTYAVLDLKASISYTDSLLNSSDPAFNRFSSEIQMSGKKLKLGGNIFFDTDFIAAYRNREQYINLRSTNANTEGLIDLNAKIKIDEEQHYNIGIQNLSFATEDYLWMLNQGAKIELSRQAVRFENVFLENAEQQVHIDGFLELSGSGKIAVSVQNVALADFRRFVFADPEKRFTGNLNLNLNIEGTLNDPVMALQLWCDELAFDKMNLGHIQLQGAYAAQLLNLKLTANRETERYDSLDLPALPYNHITAQAFLPIDLRFSVDSTRLRQDKELFATLRCDDVAPSVIEYLLPFFSHVQGKLPLTASVTGYFPNPKISIETNLTNLKATVTASQVPYVFNGKIQVSPSKVEWENLSIKDFYGGSGASSGVVFMDNFTVRDISISGSCQKLRLFDREDTGGEDPFGEITASTNNLLFYGTLNSPVLEGSLEIDATQYTMFKSGASSKAKLAEAGKFITYTAREDTSLEARLSRDEGLNKTLSLFQEDSKKIKQSTVEESFMDKLRISNFLVKNKRPITFSIIFDRYTGERLLAEISETNLTIQKRGQNYTARGSVNISSGKYDFATTSFDIRSGGKLTWNNVDVKNATMESLYADKDVRINDNESNEVDDVQLSLYIGGTLTNPQVEMGYWLNGSSQPYSAESEFGDETSNIDPNAQLNVLTMLFARQWYVKPGSSSAIGGNSALTSIGLSTGAGLISSQLSRLATGIPGLRSVNINIASDAAGTPTGVDLSIALTVPGTDGRLKLITSGSTAKSTVSSTEDAGYYTNEQRLEYQLTDNVSVEAYRSFGINRNTFSYGIGDQVLEVWGMSISYREEFRTWSELWQRIFNGEEESLPKEEGKVEQNPPNKKSDPVSAEVDKS
ncbi:translocation/assembly module TamB domain-containing protein [Chloroherpeton thalassium]|nr:translocation/assembly module TamB domain-containing protein [Chloroherpeton thalassium]